MYNNMSKLVAIHQPNFFPWLGYFNKIHRADCFIIMNNVQFQKKGGTWLNRVQLLIANKAIWCTVPIERSYHGVRDCKDITINYSYPWQKKLLTSIKQNYARAPFFNIIYPLAEELMYTKADTLADYNIQIIQTLLDILNLKKQHMVLGSSLETTGSGTDLLISMVNSVGGSGYLCGGGADDYQQDHKFSNANLSLVYQSFKQPEYQQFDNPHFTPGLSILDALMHCGVERTSKFITKVPE